MSEEIKLTLDEEKFGLTLEDIVPEKKEEAAKDYLSEENLSEEEKRQVAAFAEKIDVSNSNVILQYGAAAQKKMADFSESALENVRAKDLGEVGEMISSLVGELRSFNADTEDKGAITKFFKRMSNKISTMSARYDKVENSVEKISGMLEGHQVQLLKDVAMLDQMYKKNLVNFKELTMYIIAGKKKLAEVRETLLPKLVEKAKETGLAEDAQAANDLSGFCDRFEKKLHDLELTRMIALQMAPQIRLVQNNDTLMAEKIQSTLHNTIPLWKSQMVIALGLEHSRQATEAQREVTNMTNELLRKNAEKLKIATIETAREGERGIVDMETLQNTNQMLIETLDEVVKIQDEGRARRKSAEAELGRIEGELKNKLLEIRG